MQLLKFSVFAVFLIAFTMVSASSTSVDTNSIETANINSPQSQLKIGSLTNFTGNALKAVSKLFFSSTAYIIQNSDGSDMVFQLDDSGGTRNTFLTFDNSDMSADFGVSVNMGSNQVNMSSGTLVIPTGDVY